MVGLRACSSSFWFGLWFWCFGCVARPCPLLSLAACCCTGSVRSLRVIRELVQAPLAMQTVLAAAGLRVH
eukprot:730489-Pyramimonas_sp.AAC.1